MSLRDAAQPLKRHAPALYTGVRRLADLRGHLPPRELEGIPGRVHRNDFMLYGRDHVQPYARSGQETADLVLAAASGTDPKSWLDFGCGYGRVLRWVAQEVSGSSVGCFDVNEDAASFCSREFGATQLRSSVPLSELTLGRWDVVYAVSIVTHLPGDDFFRLMPRLLTPGGIAFFTTHGSWSVDNLASYGPEYAGQEERVRTELDDQGFSYIPYAHGDGSLGMTWHTPAYVVDHVPGLELVSHTERGVPGNHDVFVFQAP